MAQQGKCTRCKVRFEWEINRPLRNAHCPHCGLWLEQTSSQLRKWPTERRYPITRLQAIKKFEGCYPELSRSDAIHRILYGRAQ